MGQTVNVRRDDVDRQHVRSHVVDTAQGQQFHLPGLIVVVLLVVGLHECTADETHGDKVGPDRSGYCNES